MERISATLVRLPVPLLVTVTAAGFVAQRVTQTVLDTFYARSGYPVPYYRGQLSFSADRLEGWYAAMLDAGTLDVYRQTQLVDFGFIAATALFFTALLAVVARAFPAGHRGRRLATALVPLGLAAPLFDVIENLVSFVMLADPTEISQPVAIAYSCAAAVKFGAFLAVYLWVALGLAAAGVARGRQRRTTPSQRARRRSTR